MTSESSKIIIVGAGVLGLSTALHLRRAGYQDITVFDRCDYASRQYNPSKGCDSASADINKIFRADYITSQAIYRKIALEARDAWLRWNEDISRSHADDLPAPLTPTTKLFDVCGVYRLRDGYATTAEHRQLLDDMRLASPELSERQFIKGDAEAEKRLLQVCPEFYDKYHLFDEDVTGRGLSGFLSAADGILLADKACVYAHHLCIQAGVKFVLGEKVGRMKELMIDQQQGKRVTGIRTFDGLVHEADTTVIACGAWTAEALPEAHRTVEATAGTVVFIDVPIERNDIRDRFHPDNFPVRAHVFGTGDQAFEGYMFPITDSGRIKFGFRAKNFTNYQDHPTQPGLRVSIPRTRYSDNPITTVPLHGLTMLKDAVEQAFPELAEFGFTESRLCWYTDSTDHNLVVDYVPTYTHDSLFVVSGACGHGFKYLPVLGKYVKDVLERKENDFTSSWKWREIQDGVANNGLEEGEAGPRNMAKVVMAKPSDFFFAARVGGLAGNDSQEKLGVQTIVAGMQSVTV